MFYSTLVLQKLILFSYVIHSAVCWCMDDYLKCVMEMDGLRLSFLLENMGGKLQ